MDLNVEREGNLLFVNLGGRLDGSNSRDFEASLNSEIGDSNCSVILHLGELAYISSAGLRAILLITSRRAQAWCCAAFRHKSRKSSRSVDLTRSFQFTHPGTTRSSRLEVSQAD